MKTIIAILILTTAAFVSACNQVSLNAQAVQTPTNKNVSNTNSSTDANATKSGFKVEFKTASEKAEAGKDTTLVLTVKDGQGAIVKDLQIVHTKPMHLIVVSEDLSEFYHIHPEVQTDGSYQVAHNFPNGGNYYLYADFTPKDAKQVVEHLNLKVEGRAREKTALVADAKLEKVVDGLRVEMKPQEEIVAGKEMMIDFNVFDEKTNKPVADLQKYLGEYAHFVIISQNLKDFVHAHPMSKEMPMEMPSKTDESKPHSHDAKSESAAASPFVVSAHIAFPTAGLYKVWAQFQRGGRVITVPFTVNVKALEQNAAIKGANVPANAIKITVSKNGYEPSEIKLEKGKPAKLAFYRADAENCGGEVVFSKLNITRKLPVGETVLIEFTPNDAGEISFACGMGMMKGKVLVQ